MKLTDEDIINAIHRGEDTPVLKYLYKSCFPYVKELVRKNGGQEDDAKDVFQEAVMVFYSYVKKGKFTGQTNVAGFIYQVCKNQWINTFKRNQKMVLEGEFKEDALFELDAVSLMISKEREEFIHAVFSRIGERCQQLLHNSMYLNLSMKEICEKMGFANENTAKTKHYKCKQRLIEVVKENPSFKNFIKEV